VGGRNVKAPWAHLLKQQSSLTIYISLTKENNLPFSISVCSEQTEVGHFRFPFAANKQEQPFSDSYVFLLLSSGNMESRTWKHGDMVTWRHGNMKTWTWDMEIMEK
jgi:hypothetical protein